MTRHESRELAFILIFEKSFQEDVTIIELIESALELELFPANAFAENLARKAYDNLEEIANLRLQYSEMSLKDLGEMLSVPVGKSGVNHRLRKISQIAEELRKRNWLWF